MPNGSTAPTVHLPAWFGDRSIFPIAGGFIIALALVGAAGRAHAKLFWHDEIYTITITALPLREQWNALLAGVDAQPPLFFAITRLCYWLAGDGHIAMRLPGIVGVMTGVMSVGVIVRRRNGGLAGLLGMLLLLNSIAYTYAYEARPYGLVIGFSGLALVCWQAAAASAHRRAGWLAGTAVALAAAVSCHYFTVLLLAPLALAEAARFLKSRRPDWPMWLALCAPLAPLIVFLPMINVVRSFATGFFSPPQLRTIVELYESGSAGLIVPFMAVIGVSAMIFGLGGRANERDNRPSNVPFHEWICAIALLLLPLIAYAGGFVTGGFVPRYSIQWVLGFSIIVPFIVSSVRGAGRVVLIAAVGVLYLWTAGRQVSSARWLLRDPPTIVSVYPSLLTAVNRDLPVVITHGHVFLVLRHYAPQISGRLFYLSKLSGPDAIHDQGYRDFLKLTRYKPLNLEDIDAFSAQHQRFLVYGPTRFWLTGQLLQRGARLVLLGQDSGDSPFAMTSPGPSSLFAASFDGRDSDSASAATSSVPR
jgi:hypothetical protein